MCFPFLEFIMKKAIAIAAVLALLASVAIGSVKSGTKMVKERTAKIDQIVEAASADK